jgi:enamine deaminase RidA (YjgF/YER057c/UK114 family)
MSVIQSNLKKLGLTVPTPVKPIANYLPVKKVGNLIFVSGQLPIKDGKVAVKGKVGQSVTIDDAKEACKLCVINAISHVSEVLHGDLSRIASCVKVGVFVNCGFDFYDHPAVANGASDFICELMGDSGKHSRFALGVSSLPLDACVEIEFIFEINTN